MHRVAIYSEAVCNNGESLYGKLYEGDNEADIVATVRADLKRLSVQEQWEG